MPTEALVRSICQQFGARVAIEAVVDDCPRSVLADATTGATQLPSPDF